VLVSVAAATHLWFGPPQLEQLEARIARRKTDAYNRLLDADGLPRSLYEGVLDLLVRGDLLTRIATSRLQRLRAAVAGVRQEHTASDLTTRSLLSVHAGLSLLLLDCESYRREVDVRRRGEQREAA
jgi:hypothetical protein